MLAKRPDLFDQPAVELPIPLAGDECLDRLAPVYELGAIAWLVAIGSVSFAFSLRRFIRSIGQMA